jgi:crotonobetainyl-CoA:carnitine CoA-transferase CaiB-like acyl-CoA transferase
MENSGAVQAALAAEFAKHDGEAIEATLSSAGVPCGLVRTIPEACEMPHLAGRELVHEFSGVLPEEARGRALNAGFLCDEDGPELSGPPPRLGQHTRDVLASLGYAAGEIDGMLKSGAASEG